jgi:hypothetical protein
VPGPPGEEEVEAPPNPAEEGENPAADAGGDRVAEDDNGPPSPDMGGAFRSVEQREAAYAFSAAGPSRERIRASAALDQTRSHDFYQGRRLGRLENRVAAWKRRLAASKGNSLHYARRLRARRMALGPEFGWRVYVPGGHTSSDED